MNRLGKKCVVVSSSLHGLLVLILIFGSALMPNPDEDSSIKPLTVYDPNKISDLLQTSGGDPNVQAAPTPAPTPAPKEKTQTAAAMPPAPQPQPQPKPAPAPQPVHKEVVETEVIKPSPMPKRLPTPRDLPKLPEPKVVEDDNHWYSSFFHNQKPVKPTQEAETAPKKHVIKLDGSELHQTSRDGKEHASQQAAAANNAQKHRAKQLASAYNRLAKSLSNEPLVTSAGIEAGVGDGGEARVNYNDIIISKYYNAWVIPTDLEESVPSVKVSITISRTGEVINAHIVKGSGISTLDRSVQNALDNVSVIEPFPAGSKDNQRTVIINFNTQAKRQLG